MAKKKIVILGAGYGGLRTLRNLQKAKPDAEITIINKNDYHYEATWLHEVAAGTIEANDACFPIKDQVKGDTKFIQDAVVKVNKDDKTVELEQHGLISYDYLLFALGFESESFGTPGVEEYTLPIADIPSTKRIREHIETKFAEWKTTQNDELLTIIVGGAGFTGFEFLGELTNRIPHLVKQYDVPREKIRIICIEAAPSVLPMFTKDLANYAISRLEDRGVEFKIGHPIKEATPDSVIYADGEELKEIKAATFIWGAGVRGSSVVGASGFDERRGRVMVNANLTVPGNEEILILGDCSAVMDPANNRPYPTTAQIAIQQADYAAANLVALINGQPLKDFVYKPKGTVCSLGDNDAMGLVGDKPLKGYRASVIKKVIDDRSILMLGGIGTMLKKGKFQFYK